MYRHTFVPEQFTDEFTRMFGVMASADRTDVRNATEQRMCLIVQTLKVVSDEGEQEQIAEFRSLLTPAQYRAMSEHGRQRRIQLMQSMQMP
jgi:hypothetical protein